MEILTNDELHARARRLARALLELGGYDLGRPGGARRSEWRRALRVSSRGDDGRGRYSWCSARQRRPRSHLASHIASRPCWSVQRAAPGGCVTTWQAVAHRIAIRQPHAGCSPISDLIEQHAPLETIVPRGPGEICQLCYTSGSTRRAQGDDLTRTKASMRSGVRSERRCHPAMSLFVLVSPSLRPRSALRFIGMRFIGNYRYVLSAGIRWGVGAGGDRDAPDRGDAARSDHGGTACGGARNPGPRLLVFARDKYRRGARAELAHH